MRHVWLIAMIALACSGGGTPSNTAADTATVRKLPAAPPPRTARADTIAALDSAWRQERSAINAEAATLDTLPSASRFTADYAERFDALRRRALRADSLHQRLRRYLVKLKENS